MQRIARLAATPPLMALRQALAARKEAILETAIAIQQIPAPTFAEGPRAAHVAERFRRIPGLDSIDADDVHNVYARLPGADPARPVWLVSAHTDTVFDAQTSLALRRENDRLHGPGIGDNSLGVAALLHLAELMAGAGTRWPADVWFVANSREEGLGDLGGIRAVQRRFGGRLCGAVVIEGMALGRVYHAGIAVRRLKIVCSGPGGHSWLHFGRASAVHGLMRLGAQIAALKPPESPRTTFNIGVVEGGTSVNTIAASASLLLDLRSESPDALAALEKTVRDMVVQAADAELRFAVTVVGDRPAGSIPRAHPLVALADDVLGWLNIAAAFETGSTDANALLAAGVPTITVGVTHGGNAHRLDEFIDTPPVETGVWQLALIVAGALNGLAE
ncbi:MAG: M20/M25/M40 family metallo-hydrolase [Anaerolineae bacterium]|nr:M20/M25/M40 family metallo-hydrolase [Anaerolineae bacterium]